MLFCFELKHYTEKQQDFELAKRTAVIKVLMRTGDSSFPIWKRLQEILIDQTVIYQTLFLI